MKLSDLVDYLQHEIVEFPEVADYEVYRSYGEGEPDEAVDVVAFIATEKRVYL